MKTLVTCAGLAVVGALTANAQTIGEPSMSKLWSVSAKLRGFYDDNYNTAKSDPAPGYPHKQHSWGVSFAPSVAVNWIRDLTSLHLRYNYDMRWYENRPEEEVDHTHVADVTLFHDFSERYRLEVKDRFAYASEPDILEPGPKASFYRTEGSNYRNYGAVNFYADLTETIGTRVGYENRFYDYEQDGPGSRSALLDRVEHRVGGDLRWHMQPTTTALVGYEFGYTDQTSDDPLSRMPGAPTGDFRDQRSHYVFLGADHQFTPVLSTQARLGVQYADYFRADEDYVAPYADVAVTYEYSEGSRLIVGVNHGIGQTDLAMLTGGNGATVAAESTMCYAAVSHRITPRIRGFVRGAWQASQYQNGPFDDQWDHYWTADVNVTYTVNEYVAVEAGYLFDRLDSDFGARGYSRNRGYLGIKATY